MSADGSVVSEQPTATRQQERVQVADLGGIYQDGTLVLVGCGSEKRDPEDPTDRHLAAETPADRGVDAYRWEARDLYTSSYFAAKWAFGRAVTGWNGDSDPPPLAVLSAEHAVLWPWSKVARYDTSIEDLGGDPTKSDHRVDMHGKRRPDGREIVTERDLWAAQVAYGLAKWLAMFRDGPADTIGATPMHSLLVLAGQRYIQPLRERGVFDHSIERMARDPNADAELDVHVRYLFEEIDAGGVGEQLAWLSDATDRLGGVPESSEQNAIVGTGGES